MNTISIKGGRAAQRELIVDVISFCLSRLLPRHRTIDIDVSITKSDGIADGYMWAGDTNREFFMQIDKTLSVPKIIRTVCHEMVHVKQHVRGECDLEGKRWKSRKISSKTDYFDLPWEKEAFKMQDELAVEYLLRDI